MVLYGNIKFKGLEKEDYLGIFKCGNANESFEQKIFPNFVPKKVSQQKNVLIIHQLKTMKEDFELRNTTASKRWKGEETWIQGNKKGFC